MIIKDDAGLDGWFNEDGSFTMWVPVKPRTKQRPRLGRRRKAYTPQATKDAEATLADAYRTVGGPHFGAAQVEMTVEYLKAGQRITIRESACARPKSPTGDLDNYLKLTSDALNGVAWDDDRQVVVVVGVKGDLDPHWKPPLDTTMTNDTDEANIAA